MNILKKQIIILCIFLLSITSANAQVFSFESESKEHTAVFPRGTMIKAVLQNTISTKINNVGDAAVFIVDSDLLIGNAICIPEGSYLYGKVLRIEKAKKGRDGLIQIIIYKIMFPDGWQTQMSGRIWTRDGTGIMGGNTTKRVEYKKIPHYIDRIGPVAQLVKTGERKMGQERAMPAGKNYIIVLNQDLKVNYLESFE